MQKLKGKPEPKPAEYSVEIAEPSAERPSPYDDPEVYAAAVKQLMHDIGTWLGSLPLIKLKE